MLRAGGPRPDPVVRRAGHGRAARTVRSPTGCSRARSRPRRGSTGATSVAATEEGGSLFAEGNRERNLAVVEALRPIAERLGDHARPARARVERRAAGGDRRDRGQPQPRPRAVRTPRPATSSWTRRPFRARRDSLPDRFRITRTSTRRSPWPTDASWSRPTASASAETAEHDGCSPAAALGAKLTIAHAVREPRSRRRRRRARAEKDRRTRGALHEVALSAEAPADAILMTASQTDTEPIVHREHWALGLRAALRQRVAPGRDPRAVRRAAHPGAGPTTSGRTAPALPAPADRDRRQLVDGRPGGAQGYALAKRLKRFGDAAVRRVIPRRASSSRRTRSCRSATRPASRRRSRSARATLRRDRRRRRERGLRPRGDRQTEGLTGAKAALLGSVPRDVRRERPCDVLVGAHRRPEPGGDRARRGRHRQVGRTTRWRSTGTRRASVTTMSAKCTHAAAAR